MAARSRRTSTARRGKNSPPAGGRSQGVRIRAEAILHAAQVELCEKGYDQATISGIARRANVADGTIYKYATDKRELLFRVLARVIGQHVDETVRIADQLTTATEKLECFCYRHLLFWDQNRKLSLLYAAESRTRDRLHWPTYRDVNRKYVQLVQKAIEDGIAKGEFRISVSSKFLRDMIIGSVEQIAWSFTSGERAIEPHNTARDIVKIFMHGIGPASAKDQEPDLAARLERIIEMMEEKADGGNGGL